MSARHGGGLGCKRLEDGRRVRRWQEGSKMAGGFEDGRRVRRWQEGSKMAGGFEDGRSLLKWPRRGECRYELGVDLTIFFITKC